MYSDVSRSLHAKVFCTITALFHNAGPARDKARRERERSHTPGILKGFLPEWVTWWHQHSKYSIVLVVHTFDFIEKVKRNPYPRQYDM